jgi:hypothetical protein
VILEAILVAEKTVQTYTLLLAAPAASKEGEIQRTAVTGERTGSVHRTP